MSADTYAVTSPSAGSGQRSTGSRLLTIASMMAGSCALLAAYAIVVTPPGFLISLAWKQVAPAKGVAVAFDSTAFTKTALLGGVSGEAIGSQPAQLAVLTKSEISPVALDRLSAGDCISLTTSSGQKLSFRILGTQKTDAGAQRTGAQNSIDLAVTACSEGDDVILKAVIETKADTKQSAVQRNL